MAVLQSPHVTDITTAAAAITTEASQPNSPNSFSGHGMVNSPMTLRCEPISIIATISGTAATPLTSVLQYSALIGRRCPMRHPGQAPRLHDAADGGVSKL